VILEEVRMNEDNPARVVDKALFREAYKLHPYGRPVIGFVETIRKTTREDLLAYFHANYVPGNMVLVIAGAVDPKTSRPLIEKTFGSFPPVPRRRRPGRSSRRRERPGRRQGEGRAARLHRDGFHGPSMRDPDVYAWDLLSMILGSGETSRLYRGVKDGKGLVDSVTASSYTPRDPGLLFVGGTLSPEKAPAALKEILLETFRMTAAPPEGRSWPAPRRHGDGFPVLPRVAVGGGPPRRFLRDHAERRGVRADVPAQDPRGDRRRHPGGREEVPRPREPDRLGCPSAGQGGILPVEEVRTTVREAYREATAPAAKAEAKGTVVKEVLANGIRVIVRENRAVPVVAVQAGSSRGCAESRRKEAASPTSPRGCLRRGRHTVRRGRSPRRWRIWGGPQRLLGRNSFGMQGKFLQRDFEKGFRLFAESLLAPDVPGG